MRAKVVLWNRQWFRVSLGVFLILVGLYIVTPYLLNVTSNRGIINASTAAVTSPISGFVRDEGRAVGGWIEQGERLVTISNDNQDRSFINELHTERRTLEQRVQALAVQATDLEAIKCQLDEERAAYQRFTRERITHEIAALEADLAASRTVLATVERNRERQSQLRSNGYSTGVQVEDLTDRANELQAGITATQARIKVLETDRAALEAGTYVGVGRNDVPYSSQRADEIRILLADIAARSSEYRARIEQIDRQIAVEQDRLERTARFEVTSPVSGVLWRNYTYPEMAVPPDNELMVVANCSSVFVDTLLSNSDADAVTPGTQVKVRLLGEFDDFEGTVAQVYGASMKSVDRTQAAVLPEVDGSEIVVRVAIDLRDLPQWKENACYIGRQVSVKFPGGRLPSVMGMFKALASVY